MKWWKCEECSDEDHNVPCFLASHDGPKVSCAFSPRTNRCPFLSDLEAGWVECGPAPHEPTCKPTLQVEDDPLPARECKACGGSGKVFEQYQRYVDESDPNPKRVRWHSTAAECPICGGKGYVE